MFYIIRRQASLPTPRPGNHSAKPLIIKESFAYSGMHTIAQFLALFQDLSAQPDPDRRAPENKEPALMREDACAQMAWSTSNTDSGLIASHL
jgi:hypothetical protein